MRRPPFSLAGPFAALALAFLAWSPAPGADDAPPPLLTSAVAFVPDDFQAILVQQPIPDAMRPQAELKEAPPPEETLTTSLVHVQMLAQRLAEPVGRLKHYLRAAWRARRGEDDGPGGFSTLEVLHLARPVEKIEPLRVLLRSLAGRRLTIGDAEAWEFKCDARDYLGTRVVLCLVEPTILVVASSQAVLKDALARRGDEKAASVRTAGVLAAAKGIDTRSFRWDIRQRRDIDDTPVGGYWDLPRGVDRVAFSWVIADPLGVRFASTGRGAELFRKNPKWFFGIAESFGTVPITEDAIQFDPGGTDKQCSGQAKLTEAQFAACHMQLLLLWGYFIAI